MKRLIYATLFLILASAGFPAALPSRAVQRLELHGIDLQPEVLARFLTNGFAEGVDYTQMPKEPGEKCQLLIDAMQIAGVRKDVMAVDPLMKLARKDPSSGIESIIQHDLLLTPPADRSQRRDQIVRFLQYNAVVALSMIGDQRALPILQTLFHGEEDPVVRAQYALGMACLGDGGGIEFLLAEIQKGNQQSSVASAQAIYYISGIDFGLRATSPVKLRQKLADDYKKWWEESDESFQIEPQAIISRRLTPPVAPRLNNNKIRDLVAMSTNYADFDDRMGSRTAEKRLEDMGESAAGDLKQIASNPMEDLIVRSAALRRYVVLKKKDAKGLLKKSAKDENPEIAKLATDLLEKVESGEIAEYSYNTYQTINPTNPSEEPKQQN